ncbi:acyl-CoA thioester hydrolase/BAAT C-terminal domain-containing protein [Brevundimonas sp.]|uniref:acyl-CoA thioester hydrolase/BAAT C-terminal domain-containing protein n=1 Tax=Brevundimonas sp. TaxID=1871086 RepID=UPI002D3CD12D|nr:acyl-CoA thioester hydrolase/BAAT C-terminal domain-containing protein [Brevundimonas sp.]HYC74769.1 acyl-CoA thioester hydrolase/BAAT C-terminal domain-containing protein [Brevundimonas sp.]
MIFASLAASAALAVAGGQTAVAPPPPHPQTAPVPIPATEIVREDGLVAEYFAARGEPVSPGAVVVLGGSEGGLRGARNLARRLAGEGFASIAVSYFGEEGQPTKLDGIPIESVSRAIDWLQAHDVRGPVAAVGVSKGAELALLSASREPRIKAVVAAVPSHLVWQGIDMAGGQTGSSWSADGAPLAYTPYDLSNGFTSIFNLYRDSLPGAVPDSEIPVEAIAGPVMLVSGEADGLWPSTEMAQRIEQRLREKRFAHPVVNLSYPDAGHAVFGPPVAADTPGLQNILSLGGTIDGLIAARADGWPQVLAFPREALD